MGALESRLLVASVQRALPWAAGQTVGRAAHHNKLGRSGLQGHRTSTALISPLGSPTLPPQTACARRSAP